MAIARVLLLGLADQVARRGYYVSEAEPVLSVTIDGHFDLDALAGDIVRFLDTVAEKP